MGPAVVFPAVLAPTFKQFKAQLLVTWVGAVPTFHQRYCQCLAPFTSRDAQSAGNELADQDAGLHRDGARGNEVVIAAFRDIIMISVEGPFRNPGSGCERVQLIQRGVRNEVRKDGSVRWPQGRIDVDGHCQSVPM